MSGTRLAAPLQALRDGASPWMVGVILALFAAAPAVLAIPAGRYADRNGYHAPVHLAIAVACLGCLCAWTSTWVTGPWHWAFLFCAACLCGAGANTGLIAIQRTAGRSAETATDRVRIFSWLGMAPALANVVGPVLAGVLIDHAGFAAAYASMAGLPLVTLLSARLVPHEAPAGSASVARRTAWNLWLLPGMGQLLLINWLLSACWDVHSFAIPVLGHARGFSASAIGSILGAFPLAVSLVRFIIPWVAHRMHETQVLRVCMLGTAGVFAFYPFAPSVLAMIGCASVLGLMLGSVQPMVLSTLHHLTPADRHGEAIALRSATLNLSSTFMPMAFGAAGAVAGVSALFWTMGAAVGAGNWVAGRLEKVRHAGL